jgi:Ca2+-binding EF-hand superfamily protein
MKSLMAYYDIDGDGNVNFDEFLRGLRYVLIFTFNRDPLTERRRNMVDKAFFLMDKDASGNINVQDIATIYDVSQNQDFKDGKKTRDEVLMGFLDSFDGAKGNNDGNITKEEWNDYYTDLSMSTPSDDYFVVMME